MAVNRAPKAGRRSRSAGSFSRQASRRLRMPERPEDELEYPQRLLRYPSAAMFLLMREAFRLGQERAAAATTPAERIRFPQFCVLACLEEFGGGSQREISDRLRFDPSDLVDFVDGLEAAGFVRRRRDARDRRRYIVDLTPAGRRALQVRGRSADRYNDDLFAGLDEREREQLRDLLLRAFEARRRS